MKKTYIVIDSTSYAEAEFIEKHGIEVVPSPVEAAPATILRKPVNLPALAEAGRAIERQVEVEGIIDSLLHSVREVLGYHNALVLILDAHRGCLITTGSIGYERSGLGSEASRDEGLIGAAATSGHTIKVSDMSRVRRFGGAIITDTEVSENTTRIVAFPKLPTAMSQIAVPMMIRDEAIGVLFAESQERMAFREEDEAALEILARQASRALKASELTTPAAEPTLVLPTDEAVARGRGIRVIHHRVDDSIFVDGTYIVKGIAGALLRLMLEWHLNDGRSLFSNRELRLALAARMPELKDNLETRLLLLRRRLEEKQAPIQILRTGRGRLRMEAEGPLILAAAPE